MKTRYFAALLAATALAAPAFAQDMPGFRIEGRVGWESGRASADYVNPDEDEDEEGDEILTRSQSESSINYGLEVGYDLLLGENFVLGAYGGVDLSDFDSCSEVFEDDLGCVSSGRTFTAGVRAGVALTPSFLIYAKGGYSNGRVKFSYDSDVEDDDPLDADVAEVSDNRNGFHVGAGAELAFTRNLYGKLEYVYSDFGTYRFAGDEDDGQPTVGIGLSRHQVVAGLGLRF